jgi:hypothetical protein
VQGDQDVVHVQLRYVVRSWRLRSTGEAIERLTGMVSRDDRRLRLCSGCLKRPVSKAEGETSSRGGGASERVLSTLGTRMVVRWLAFPEFKRRRLVTGDKLGAACRVFVDLARHARSNPSVGNIVERVRQTPKAR